MLLVALALMFPTQSPESGGPRDLAAILQAAPAMAPFAAALAAAREHRLQILVAEPVVDGDRVLPRRSRLGDPDRYFYPASAIKLCGAVAVLERLQAIDLAEGAGFGLDSRLVIEPRFDGDRRIDRDESNVDGGALTVRSMLRKMLLVSDNQAYNHCFELVGPDRLNRSMWAAGFPSARLWHRLSEARTLAENRQTRGVVLQQGEAVLHLPPRPAAIELSNVDYADLEIGAAYFAAGERVDEPMSFAQKNAIRLDELQDVLVAVLRPEIDTGRRGFPDLSLAHRRFLVEALGQLPRESTNPRYDPAQVPDDYCKFVLPGVRRVIPAEHARVYGKTGRAYGFTIENCYVEDLRTGRGFFLAMVLYANPNETLNDDDYAYETLADPFLAAVGEVLTRAVLGSR